MSPRTRQRASGEEAASSGKRNQAGSVQQRKGLNLTPLELASKSSEPLKVDNTAMFDNDDDNDDDDDDDDDDEEDDEDDDKKGGSNARGCRCGRSRCLKQYCQCFK